MNVVFVGLEREQGESVGGAAIRDGGLGRDLHLAGEDAPTVARYPDEVVGRLVVTPPCFTGLQGI